MGTRRHHHLDGRLMSVGTGTVIMIGAALFLWLGPAMKESRSKQESKLQSVSAPDDLQVALTPPVAASSRIAVGNPRFQILAAASDQHPLGQGRATLRLIVLMDGRRAGGLSVEAARMPPDGIGDPTPVFDGQANNDGEVEFELDPGAYQLTAWDESHLGASHVELWAGDSTTAEVEVNPTVEVVGRVIEAWTGLPVEGAVVNLYGVAAVCSARTDASGRFSFPWLPAPSSRYLRVRAEGYGGESASVSVRSDGTWRSSVAWGFVKSGDAPRAPRPNIPGPSSDESSSFGQVSAPSAEQARREGRSVPVTIPDVQLVPARKLTGRLLGPDGGPAVGALVRARGNYSMRPGIALPDVCESRADLKGRFVIGGLRSDIGHEVRFSFTDAATHATFVLPGFAERIDLGTLRFGPASKVVGRVVDARGLGVVDIPVRLDIPPMAPRSDTKDLRTWRDASRSLSERLMVRTGVEGEFEFLGLLAGTILIAVEVPSGVLEEREIAIHQGDTRDIQFLLPASTPEVAGRVLRDGVGVAGANVLFKQGSHRRSISCAHDGSFRIVGLDPRAGGHLSAVYNDPSGVVLKSRSKVISDEEDYYELMIVSREDVKH